VKEEQVESFNKLRELAINVLQSLAVCFQSIYQLWGGIQRFLWNRLAKPFEERPPTCKVRALMRRTQEEDAIC